MALGIATWLWVESDGSWIGFWLSLPISVPGLFLVVYGSFWKIEVVGSWLKVFRPGRMPLEMDMQELDYASRESGELRLYKNGRVLCAVTSFATNYRRFYKQLEAAGKLDSERKNRPYVMRQGRVFLVLGIGCVAVGILFAVLIFSDPGEILTVPIVLCLAAFFLLGAYSIVYWLRWRLVVGIDTLVCRSPFRREREVVMRELTAVILRGRGYVYAGVRLLCNDKPIMKVWGNCRGYPLFEERLKAKGVRFVEEEAYLKELDDCEDVY